MKNYLDYPLIIVLSLLQASFLPLNLIIVLLLFWLFRHGLNYFFPRAALAAVAIGLFTASSVGVLLFVFGAIAFVAFAIRSWLPSPTFVRVALIILAMPTSEILYRKLFSFWGGL